MPVALPLVDPRQCDCEHLHPYPPTSDSGHIHVCPRLCARLCARPPVLVRPSSCNLGLFFPSSHVGHDLMPQPTPPPSNPRPSILHPFRFSRPSFHNQVSIPDVLCSRLFSSNKDPSFALSLCISTSSLVQACTRVLLHVVFPRFQVDNSQRLQPPYPSTCTAQDHVVDISQPCIQVSFILTLSNYTAFLHYHRSSCRPLGQTPIPQCHQRALDFTSLLFTSLHARQLFEPAQLSAFLSSLDTTYPLVFCSTRGLLPGVCPEPSFLSIA